ncbi:MAG: TIM barrel protein [Chthoniobacterales bacterium]|nr:TIM barrel protein [Chthoniobacterales bacterium]
MPDPLTSAGTRGRPGLVTVTFRQLAPEEIVAVAKSCGLQVLEWGGDVHVPAGDTKRARDVAALTRAAGLETVCYGSYYRAGHEGEGGKPRFADVLETAVSLGAPCIRVWAGNRGSEVADEAYFRHVCADAERIAGLADARGIRIAFEFHSGTLHDNAEAAGRLLGALPHPNIFSLWQPLVLLDAQQRERSLRAVLPRLAHVHVFHWVPGDPADRRSLCEGEDDWHSWLETIRAAGIKADALLEFVKGDAPEALAADASVLRRLTGFAS